jgi:tRNA threonylcarbamoyladenosine modification (KEOPS) complex  Pcc1 subunit
VKLKVESDDLHALRAAANTYLRWVIMCNEIAREA